MKFINPPKIKEEAMGGSYGAGVPWNEVRKKFEKNDDRPNISKVLGMIIILMQEGKAFENALEKAVVISGFPKHEIIEEISLSGYLLSL